MKKIIYSLASLIMLMGMTTLPMSCSSESDWNDEVTVTPSSFLQITTDVVESRAVKTGTQFEAGDKIGLLLSQADGTSFNSLDKIGATYQGAGKWTLDKDVDLSDISGDVCLTAYYPYSLYVTDAYNGLVNFAKIYLSQSDDEVLVSDMVKVNRTANTAKLKFSHALARITASVKKGTEYTESGQLSAVTLQGFTTGGALTASASSSELTDTWETADLYQSANVTLSSTPQQFDFLVFPGATTENQQKIVVTVDGKTYQYPISATELIAGQQYSFNIKVGEDAPETTHEYVDLGLPSGIKWATCNIGATKPEEYGDYYAWGETVTKSEYTEANSVTYGKSLEELKSAGIIDANNNLTAAYDVAKVKWGGSWRMSTCKEQTELRTNCTWILTTQNGINCYRIESKKNGNSIFLPAAGDRYGTYLYYAGSYGFYWSSTAYDGSYSAYGLGFNSGRYYCYDYGRDGGLSVRPVTE